MPFEIFRNGQPGRDDDSISFYFNLIATYVYLSSFYVSSWAMSCKSLYCAHPRITYELWNIDSIRRCCWNVATVRNVWRYQRVIRSCKSDRLYNDQKKKDKRTNNNLQNSTQKTKDWATRISLEQRNEAYWIWHLWEVISLNEIYKSVSPKMISQFTIM